MLTNKDIDEVHSRLIRIESKLSKFMEVSGFGVNGERLGHQYCIVTSDTPAVIYGPFTGKKEAKDWGRAALDDSLWYVVPLMLEV
jgi:hypothetical protein